MVFLVFTNGTLLDEEMVKKFKKTRNLIPVLSLEGYGEETDERRGCGIYGNLVKAMGRLKREKIFFGTSLTVTGKNFPIITDREYVACLKRSGCSFYLYIEYTPVTPGTEDLVITRQQRQELNRLMEGFRKKFSALFMAVPGEEDRFGGCLSAGRGFIHINHRGDLEPCPFAPYSDISLKDTSVRKALESHLLRKIRESGENICDEAGGCSLWAKRQWVSSLLK
jgi:MoaA/NifB/PqqE/SkfB family radical SAM enzyme